MNEPQSAILTALYTRQPELALQLADQAASLTVWEAAALGRDDALRVLLDADSEAAEAAAPDGHTPVGLAAFFARVSSVRLLLDRGADPTAAARNATSVQALHAAVAGRSREIVELLLDRAVDVDARQQVGYTPLMGAAAAGREDLVELLLRHGADPALVAEDGKTAALAAREHGHAALADRLENETAARLEG
jgi:uncharacterized protein